MDESPAAVHEQPPLSRAQASPNPQKITIERYGNRFWAVYDGTDLICVCVYKRGAKEVQSRLQQNP